MVSLTTRKHFFQPIFLETDNECFSHHVPY